MKGSDVAIDARLAMWPTDEPSRCDSVQHISFVSASEWGLAPVLKQAG